MLKTKGISIRPANPDDLMELFKLIDSYDGKIECDKNLIKNNVRDFVYNDGVIVFIVNDEIVGSVAGYALPSLYSDEIFYSCMFFYVKKGFRRHTKRFVKELELMFLPTPAKMLIFGLPSDEKGKKLQRFFKSMGYEELETHLYKRL